MSVITKKRFEHLNRLYSWISKLYDWKVIVWNLYDSFESPKELVNEFFRIWYELKENINNEFPTLKSDLERLIKKYKYLAISIDYANLIKHWKLIKRLRKTKISFGSLNTHVTLFENKVKLTLELDWDKIDIKFITESVLLERNKVIKELNITI
jgi:hypothetical protein